VAEEAIDRQTRKAAATTKGSFGLPTEIVARSRDYVSEKPSKAFARWGLCTAVWKVRQFTAQSSPDKERMMIVFHLIGWGIFGLIVGGLARAFVSGPQRLGCLGTIALGVAGSLVGGWLAAVLFGGPMDQFQPAGFLGALVGAILLLGLSRLFLGRPGPE
jgi:uncharacterized membrane protein YeaQ/YmgE (transglycosylase-associated protein family)